MYKDRGQLKAFQKAYQAVYTQTAVAKANRAKYRSNPRNKLREENARLKKLYGITNEDYWNLVAKQNGVCGICFKSDGHKLHIDHDHKTGRVRGLLCGYCNRGIGMLKDDITIINSAANYLKLTNVCTNNSYPKNLPINKEG